MITTLTLNPAFDVHVEIDEFKLGHENFAKKVIRDIGGKGINISNALCENKIENTAIILLGRENSTDFIDGINRAGLNCKTVECDGKIRENITIHPSEGEETRLSFSGFECSNTQLDKIFDLIDTNGIVTFTGSLPPGIGTAEAERFLMKIRERGAKLVIDSKSISLDMLRRIKPWLIKPNKDEIAAYFGKMSERELYEIAAELNRDGIENVMISLGGDGAILANGERVWRAHVPEVDVRSTIGAGDSSIAGFIAVDAKCEERLRLAVAYGTAACLREGTNPPLACDIKEIYDKIKIEVVS